MTRKKEEKKKEYQREVCSSGETREGKNRGGGGGRCKSSNSTGLFNNYAQAVTARERASTSVQLKQHGAAATMARLLLLLLRLQQTKAAGAVYVTHNSSYTGTDRHTTAATNGGPT